MSRAGAGVGVSEERWYSAGGSLIEAVLYTYDDDGNRMSRTTSAGVEQYHYGVGWRLTSIERASTTTEAFTYDDAGRVTSLTRDGHSYALSHNALDQLVSATVDGTSTTSVLPTRALRLCQSPWGVAKRGCQWADSELRD